MYYVAAGASAGGVPGGLQPDQHSPDEAGALHGRSGARVSNISRHPPAARQRTAPRHGRQRAAESDTTLSTHVS